MAGFIVCTLPLVPLVHIARHLFVSGTNTSSLAQSHVLHGAHYFVPEHAAGVASVATTAESLLIVSGGGKELEPSTLLSDLQRRGHRALQRLTLDVGWSLVAVNFTDGSALLATDAYASVPLFVASKTSQGGEHFALSTHKSSLSRLGFSDDGIDAVPPGTVQSYAILGSGQLVHKYSVGLGSMREGGPGQLVAGKGHGAATSEPNLEGAIRRAIGQILGSPSLRRAAGDAPDGPRYFLFLIERPNCNRQQGLLLRSLSRLPLPFLVYRYSPDRRSLERTWRGGAAGSTPVRFDSNVGGQELLETIEPFGCTAHTKSPACVLVRALAAACADAAGMGSVAYLSSVGPFEPPSARIKLQGEGQEDMMWWMQAETYVAQAAGLSVGVAWPLLSALVTDAYTHLSWPERERAQVNLCSSVTIEDVKGAATESGNAMREINTSRAGKTVQRPQEGETLCAGNQEVTLGQKRRDENAISAALLRVLGGLRHERENRRFDVAIRELSRALADATKLGLSMVEIANVTAEMGVTYEMQGRLGEAVRWYKHAVDIDARLHSAYMLFARLLLGPDSSFVRVGDAAKQEAIKMLRQQVEGRGKQNAAWNELAHYGLAAALFHTAARDEAERVYEQIISVKPAAHLPVAASGRPKATSSKPLKIMCVASDGQRKELQQLRHSAERAGVELAVLGEAVQYTGHEVKLTLFLDYLQNSISDDDQLVLAVDAYDVLLMPAVVDAAEAFRSFTRPIVFSAESSCWPDEGVSLLYQKANRTASRLPYLNSGAFMGQRGDLLRMITEVMGYQARFASDQRLFTRFYLEHPEVVELDHQSQVFHNLHSTHEPLVFDPSGQAHLKQGTVRPAVLHANAGDGKHIYGPLVKAWKAATENGTVAVAANAAYFRGIAHHNAGERVLALVQFVLHTLTGGEYLPEACYNAGYLLYVLGQLELARLFYLHSALMGSSAASLGPVSNRAINNLVTLELQRGPHAARSALAAIRLASTGSKDERLKALLNALGQVLPSAYEAMYGPQLDLASAHENPELIAAYSLRRALEDVIWGQLTSVLEHELDLDGVMRRSAYVEALSTACSVRVAADGPCRLTVNRDVDFTLRRVRVMETVITGSGGVAELCIGLFNTSTSTSTKAAPDLLAFSDNRRDSSDNVYDACIADVHSDTEDQVVHRGPAQISRPPFAVLRSAP